MRFMSRGLRHDTGIIAAAQNSDVLTVGLDEVVPMRIYPYASACGDSPTDYVRSRAVTATPEHAYDSTIGEKSPWRWAEIELRG